MKKTYITLIAIPLFVCIGLVVYMYGVRDLRKQLQSDTQMGQMLWPKGARYEIVDGDMVLELMENHRFKYSYFPANSLFYFKANQVTKIQPGDDFEIGEIKFPKTKEILVKYYGEIPEHRFQVRDDIELDGITIKAGCDLKFQKNVLMSFICPDEKELFFKRFLELAPVEAGK